MIDMNRDLLFVSILVALAAVWVCNRPVTPLTPPSAPTRAEEVKPVREHVVEQGGPVLHFVTEDGGTLVMVCLRDEEPRVTQYMGIVTVRCVKPE